ncbi:MAG: ABC transporter ATP-binding protein [Chloroflexi bacterium]|nr:ABC transporter ATP-binding protein [Chloroflexota bacterium]MBU1750012.1 ABC transporter ATP-binding protein [Chloroflexota bacterium]
MEPVIRLDQVSKRFILHAGGPRSFQDTFVGLFRGRRYRAQDFWALRDVSFEVQAGEALGFIGANGSGKSTVLKLVSRILVPTTGQVHIHGQVSSLLELGAGFHPDLTGRENIYLNGSVLGLTRRQINERLGDIIDFAELGPFIDAPVKHYSSGMYMRLGFAVAVHVDPNILLVDEVLAVGDQRFQFKCYDRIANLRAQGVTILFVSHDLEHVRRLCGRAVWLEGGQVHAQGDTGHVIAQYLDQVMAQEEERLFQQGAQEMDEHRWGQGQVRITGVRFYDRAGQERHVFDAGEWMQARIQYTASGQVERPVFGVAIHRTDGLHVNGPNTKLSHYDIPAIQGEGEVHCTFEMLPLLEGSYRLSAAVYDETCTRPYDHLDGVFPFRVRAGDLVPDRYGAFYIPCQWEHIGAE